MFGTRTAAKQEAPIVSPEIQNAGDRFSLLELRRIYKQLVENKIVTESNEEIVVEILRVIAEMVVYGDNKSELLFDFFCEKNMLSLFLEIMRSSDGQRSCPVGVHIQILQTLSILISCVKNDTSLYYLLSNNHINEILLFSHDFSIDESLVAQFASFMKTLSLRLNDQTVQFFFIEETGAFPLLSKAVELLGNFDPMIRISAQTTLLNIYQVKEPQARAYALQEKVMSQLLDAVIRVIKQQYQTLEKNSIQYIKSVANNDDQEKITKCEQCFEDVFIAIEDWLYYLQDIIDLNIPELQVSLGEYILHDFIEPVIFDRITEAAKSVNSELGLDIESHKTIDNARTRSFSNLEQSIQENVVLGRAETALFFLFQISRILHSSKLKQAILTSFCHLLSADSRSLLAKSQNLIRCQVQNPNSPIPMFYTDSSSTQKINGNLCRYALREMLNRDHQKIVILALYNIYVLALHLIESTVVDLGESPLGPYSQLMYFFQSIHLLPWSCEQQEAAELHDSLSSSDGVAGENLQGKGKFLNMNELVRLNRSISSESVTTPSNSTVLDWMCQILENPKDHSLVSLQVIIHTVAMFTSLMAKAANERQSMTAQSKVKDQVVDSSVQGEQEQDEVIEEKTKALLLDGEQETQEKREGESKLVPLKDIFERIKSAVKNAALVLLSRLDSHFSEVLMILVTEELDRYSGRNWKASCTRMFTDKNLIVPTVTDTTGASTIKLGMDFVVPVSQVEIMRKELQSFLMLRGLLAHISNLSEGKNAFSNFELAKLVRESGFFDLDETSSSKLTENMSFDMKGKKFLDAVVLSNSGGAGSQSAEQARLNTAAIPEKSPQRGSILGFSLFGGGKTPNNSPPPTSSMTVSPLTNKSDNSLYGSKILFVQDPIYLILVTSSKVENRSTFKTQIVVPLVYSDAKVDLLDRRKLKLIVRSWKLINCMDKIDPDSDVREPNGPSDSLKAIQNSTSYLRPCAKSSMYEISLVMGTEQASSLAIQHVENKRKELTQSKTEKLKSILMHCST